MYAIINLLTNILMTGSSIIGCVTIINKIGKFCKVIDENNVDGYKVGFDSFMLDSIDEINRCVESISTISNNVNKVCCVLYDISTGNKFVKKDKDGKIIVCNKSKIYSGFKDKIEELSGKVKKYQVELSKIKKHKSKDKTNDKGKDKDKDKNKKRDKDESDESSSDNSSDDDSSTDDSSDSNSTYSDISEIVSINSHENATPESNTSKISKKIDKNLNPDDEFYLETKATK